MNQRLITTILSGITLFLSCATLQAQDLYPEYAGDQACKVCHDGPQGVWDDYVAKWAPL